MPNINDNTELLIPVASCELIEVRIVETLNDWETLGL